MSVLRAVDHVQLAMPAGGESAARGFYGDVLGLTEVPKPPPLAERGGAWYEDGPVRVHLGVDPDFRAARKAHVAFRVDDVGAVVDACRRAGSPVVDDELLPGYDRAYVFDPFGNRIELLRPLDTTGPTGR